MDVFINIYINIYYFLFSEYIDNFKSNNYKELKILNELILKFVNNINEENYKNIIKYLQDNKIHSNNKLIDKCMNETIPKLKKKLLKELQASKNIDYYSSGYSCEFI